jgi:hypothetical protein
LSRFTEQQIAEDVANTKSDISAWMNLLLQTKKVTIGKTFPEYASFIVSSEVNLDPISTYTQMAEMIKTMDFEGDLKIIIVSDMAAMGDSDSLTTLDSLKKVLKEKQNIKS